MSKIKQKATPDATVAVHAVFGQNLRKLIERETTIADLCRELDINRVQMGRFLNGESFPKPGLLKRFCDYFKVDGRILLEPLQQIYPDLDAKSDHDEIYDMVKQFYAHGVIQSLKNVNDTVLPDGFYMFYRESFLYPGAFLSSLTYVYSRSGVKFMRGSVPIAVPRRRSADDPNPLPVEHKGSYVKWRAVVLKTLDGIAYAYNDENTNNIVGLTYINLSDARAVKVKSGYSLLLRDLWKSERPAVPVALAYVDSTSVRNVIKHAQQATWTDFDNLPEQVQAALSGIAIPTQSALFQP